MLITRDRVSALDRESRSLRVPRRKGRVDVGTLALVLLEFERKREAGSERDESGEHPPRFNDRVEVSR